MKFPLNYNHFKSVDEEFIYLQRFLIGSKTKKIYNSNCDDRL